MDRINSRLLYIVGGPLVLLLLAGVAIFSSLQSSEDGVTAPPVGQKDLGKFASFDTDGAQYVYLVNIPEDASEASDSEEKAGGGSIAVGTLDEPDPIEALAELDKDKLVLNPLALKDWNVCSQTSKGKEVEHLSLTKSDCESFTIIESPTSFNSNPPITAKASEGIDDAGTHSRFGDHVDLKLAPAAKSAKALGLKLSTPSGINLLDENNLSKYGDYYICHQSVGSDIWLEKGSTVVLELRSQRCKYE